jgi:hypothetical protein
MFGSRLIESLHPIYRATRKRIRELPVTGEHASAAATRCLYKLDGESSASDLDRGRKSDCSCSLHHQIRHCRHHQSAAYIYQIRDSDLSSAVRLCQILRQTLDRYWLDSALSTSMLAGTNCRNYHLPRMPKSSLLCNGISDRRGREMLQIAAIPLCCCCCWLPDRARDSSEGGVAHNPVELF